MAITNPYIFGSPVKTKEMFFGREDVFAFLREHLVGTYQDNVIMLYGQRRTGKTSILYQILNNNRLGDDYVPVLISLEGLEDAETNAQIFRATASEIAITLNIDIPEHDKFDSTNSYFRYEFLDEKVKPLLNQQKLLLMIDEYEVLEECVNNPNTKVNPTLFHQFRYLMQHYDWLSFLLVGSHKLEELNADYWKEFTGTIYHTISFLDNQSAQELIEKPAAKFSVYYTTDAIETLIELSGKHPYFLQSLCRFAYANGAEKEEISKQDVDKAVKPCIEAIRNGFESIWQDLSNDEKVILSTIAHIDSDWINFSDIALQFDHLKVNWELERMKKAVQRLEYKDALKKNELRQYQYYAPFFRECVKSHQSLETILEELNIEWKKDAEFIHNPEALKAENNLKIAEEYVQLGEIKKAEKTFQYVIETYPDYIGSWLRFGKFYESQGRLDDALELYKSRLEQYPDSVDISNVIGLLLKRRNQFEDALNQFQYSLEIQKSNIVALANIEEIVPWLIVLQLQEFFQEHQQPIQRLRDIHQHLADVIQRKRITIQDEHNITIKNIKEMIRLDQETDGLLSSLGQDMESIQQRITQIQQQFTHFEPLFISTDYNRKDTSSKGLNLQEITQYITELQQMIITFQQERIELQQLKQELPQGVKLIEGGLNFFDFIRNLFKRRL